MDITDNFLFLNKTLDKRTCSLISRDLTFSSFDKFFLVTSDFLPFIVIIHTYLLLWKRARILENYQRTIVRSIEVLELPKSKIHTYVPSQKSKKRFCWVWMMNSFAIYIRIENSNFHPYIFYKKIYRLCQNSN